MSLLDSMIDRRHPARRRPRASGQGAHDACHHPGGQADARRGRPRPGLWRPSAQASGSARGRGWIVLPVALTRLFAANQARHAKMATMAASTNRPLTRKSFQKSLRVRTCSSAAWRYSAAVLCCWSSLCRSMPLIVCVCPASGRAILSARSRLSVVRR